MNRGARFQSLRERRAVEGVEVRWGLSRDRAEIAQLLELNGVPRWVAFEERFVVAEVKGEILAALRYRKTPEKLLLGLLMTDPWVEERPLAVALYAGAGSLACEEDIGEVVATAVPYSDYPLEVGYRRARGGWRLVSGWAIGGCGGLPKAGWRRAVALLGILAVPFFRASRA